MNGLDPKTALALYWAMVKEIAWITKTDVEFGGGHNSYVGYDGSDYRQSFPDQIRYTFEVGSAKRLDYYVPTDLDMFNHFLAKLIPGSKDMTEAELMEAAMFYTASRLKALESGE